MSHELRTPLNAIIGFSQVLRERMFGEVNEKQAEYLDDILSSGNHLLSLINDVLDLSKVEAGQVELEVAPFSLREALERGVVMVRERATEDGVRARRSRRRRTSTSSTATSGGSGRSSSTCSRTRSSSRRRAARSTSRAARVDGEVQVSVADTGPGIAPEDHERIFEEFQQTDAGERAARGHRPRARALEAPRRAARRPDLGRERARRGQHVRVHAAARGPA